MDTFLEPYARSIVVAVAAILLIACSSEQIASGPNVVARWQTCRDSTGGLTNHTAIENFGWTEGKLIINVKDNDYCGGTRVASPRFTVSGDRLQLSWTWELGPEKSVTACACDHAIRFELSNVPAGDYKVQLARTR